MESKLSELRSVLGETCICDLSLLGCWKGDSNLENLKLEFCTGLPFPNVVIEDFLEPDFALELKEHFPQIDEEWWHYSNPIEEKYVLDKIAEMPTCFQKLFSLLNSDSFLHVLRNLSGIEDLQTDPYLHGAGIHYHANGGKLDLHLDYGIHPISRMERRLNIILYLNHDWKDEYGGHLELWSYDEKGKPKELSKTIFPAFNSAVLFQTSDISYHGVPHRICCPEGTGRRSVACYYVSEPREHLTHREKALFVGLPSEPEDPYLTKLRLIRSSRRLLPSDLEGDIVENN